MNEFFNYSFRTFISSIHSIAKMDPGYLDLILTDYNLNLLLDDIDNKMDECYNNYLENRRLFLSVTPSDCGFYALYNSMMQKYYLELNTLYNLYSIYYKIMVNRNLNYDFKSDLDNIKLICNSDNYGLVLIK